ncbi:MAG: STAS domain-containing protein [Saprospiraceae bacterium]|nr:STAS domain-containing protein [Saprospiraceae bacterium]
MKYTIDKNSDIVKFTLGEDNLNSMIAPDLKSEFIILRNEGVKNLILVMNEVKYVDSSGLSSILTANRLWKDHGNFILADIKHDFVNRLIEISRLDSILTIAGSVEEAEEIIKNNPVEHSEEE